MKVLLTGATGFVGSHTARALLNAGHDVRVLLRSESKLRRVLGAEASNRLDMARGDVVDPVSVARAVHGCDAVIHTAAVVGVSRAAATSRSVNVEGTRIVLDAARRAGCDPLVYTSSVAALVPTSDPVLTPATPLADPPGEYGRSKVAAEVHVRALQEEGVPVTSFVVGGVYGPDQPELASALESIVAASSKLMVIPGGGIGVIDVRDLALMLVAALQPGRGPRRYMAGGQYRSWSEWTDDLEQVIGRRVRRLRVPDGALLAMGRGITLISRVVDLGYPLTYEAALGMTGTPPSDDTATLEDLGVTYRPVRQTLADSTRWLIRAGHLHPRFAPALADGLAPKPA